MTGWLDPTGARAAARDELLEMGRHPFFQGLMAKQSEQEAYAAAIARLPLRGYLGLTVSRAGLAA